MIQTMWRATMRHTGGIGNASQIVLQLNGTLDEKKFAASVRKFISAFPLLAGSESRAGSLQPYWRMSRNPATPGIRVEVHHIEPGHVLETLESLVNTPFQSTREYVVFHLLYPSDGNCLAAMVFDHRLLDARGAEQFLLLLSRYISGSVLLEEIDAMPDAPRQSMWTQIKEGFASARCVGQTIHGNVIGSGMIRLDGDGKSKGSPGRFLLHTLNEEETKAWMERIDRDAGYLMFMPYALAAASTAFRQVGSIKNQSGSFIIPCTTDLRPHQFSWKNTFFNYCSLFFFKIDSAATDSKPEVIAQFKSQFFSQTSTRFPYQFQRFMALMRFLPLAFFEWMNSWNHASFSFGSVGKSLFEGETFCGLEINNLYHMPLIPPQVGVGFFCSQINGQLNMGIAWRDGVLNDHDIAVMQDAFLGF